ncbi:MAG TPA: radical SAM protein [Syntrophales bacterium]|nr:radical SAM protein [Syntrophales bacterium]
MFDPVEMAELTNGIVCKEDRRKYYRFRPSRFYGGISTADSVGCCLRCVFCWSWNIVQDPGQCGKYYAPEDVAGILMSIAKKKKLSYLRISGNEPTMHRSHLIRVLASIKTKYSFILETNGILIGNDPTYAEELSGFSNLHVRVSLKGTCEEEFSRLTGANPEGFALQLRALENLRQYGIKVHPACMISFSPPENVKVLRKRLRAIDPAFEDFEIEELILYPPVEERLKTLNIKYLSAYKPRNIPNEQV